jgi:hypothetical protein
MSIYNYRRTFKERYLIGIVIAVIDGKPTGKKYVHNIKDTTHYKGKFCNDMKRKWPTATHVNFYDKTTGEFSERIELE